MKSKFSNFAHVVYLCISWMYRLTGSASSKRSGSNEVQLLANLAGKSEGQAFQYLHSLSELTIAKEMVSPKIIMTMKGTFQTTHTKLI